MPREASLTQTNSLNVDPFGANQIALNLTFEYESPMPSPMTSLQYSGHHVKVLCDVPFQRQHWLYLLLWETWFPSWLLSSKCPDHKTVENDHITASLMHITFSKITESRGRNHLCAKFWKSGMDPSFFTAKMRNLLWESEWVVIRVSWETER